MKTSSTAQLPRIACAGWTVRTEVGGMFKTVGSHLNRYASRLRAVEINSSFYFSHRCQTYARWAESVPADFLFASKIPKQITHERHLLNAIEDLEKYLGEISGLGAKLGPLLVQLPPSLELDKKNARRFLEALRERFTGLVACEPRHASWVTEEADRLLDEFQIARVAADPAPFPGADRPGGWQGLTYFRMHGSPVIYASSYSEQVLDNLAADLGQFAQQGPAWCVFDNTKYGAALENALALERRLGVTLDQAKAS